MTANRTGPCFLVVVSLILLGACHSSGDDTSPPSTSPPPPPPAAGLDARPSNLTCVAPAKKANPGGTGIQLQRVFPSLRFNQPLAMLQAPGDDSRWFVVEKTGTVRVFTNSANPTATAFTTLSVNSIVEGGLLGMAFDPNYATNRFVYLSFTEGTPMVSFVARFTVAPGGATLDPSSRLNILQVNQPPATNHKGGNIAFGPDGFLYLGLGDGGPRLDPAGRGQDTNNLMGDLVRIDVRNSTPETPYAIPKGPKGNPFQNNPICPPTGGAQSCPEIYASGFRNPWRWSFDSATGDLWLGDVGQELREEVDRVRLGGNYGWNCREGSIAFDQAPASCRATSAVFDDPVYDYDRTLGASVTGGYVYRGSGLPELVGQYVFGDYISGRIWRLVASGGGFTREELFDFTNNSLASFGQDNDGELYVVDILDGGLHKIVPAAGGTPTTPVPTQLSATGCVNPQNPSQAATGLVPYEPAAPFWSDNTTKERWLAIPDGTSIGVGADGDFTFPNGTVLVKHFRLNNRLVETRLFMRHPDGDWAGYSYEWNAQGTDATLVQGGKTVTIGSQSWNFLNGNDCLTCHTAAAGFSLGLEAAQLNRNLSYASTGRTANELRTLDAITMFTKPLGDPAQQPTMPNPFDTSAPLAQRARAYLHTNCSQCHRPGGVAQSSMDLRYSTLLSNTNACAVSPQLGNLLLGSAARIIAPGSAAHSVLVARMNRRDSSSMPPLASGIVDAAGVTLVQQWINSLTTCQ